MSAVATTELTALPRSRSLPTFFDNLDSFAEAPEGVAKLRELILDLAVRGKLVEQDENDEPAAKLLEGLDREKARLVKAKVIKRSEPAPFVEVDDQPFALPESWEFTRLDRVCSLVTDGEHKTPSRDPSGEIPLGTAKNIRDGYLDLDITDSVTREVAEACWKRCLPSHDDIMMVCVGATTGRLCLLKNPPEFAIVRSVETVASKSGICYPARA